MSCRGLNHFHTQVGKNIENVSDVSIRIPGVVLIIIGKVRLRHRLYNIFFMTFELGTIRSVVIDYISIKTSNR